MLRNPTVNRIEVIDVLRGIALLGIIIVHFIDQYYGAEFPDKWDHVNAFDLFILNFFDLFVSGKFYMLFAFLFGLSFFIQNSKMDLKRGGSKYFIWRLVILFILGLIHSLHYRADILSTYALLGLILLLFKRWPPKILVLVGIMLAINLPSFGYRCIKTVVNFHKTKEQTIMNNDVRNVVDSNDYFKLLKNGSYYEVLARNSAELSTRILYRIRSGKVFIILGLFLIGLGVGKLGLNNKNIFNEVNYMRSIMISLASLLLFSLLLLSKVVIDYSVVINRQVLGIVQEALKDSSNFIMALLYVSTICLFYNKRFVKGLLSKFSYVGRMGLTCYLSQTIFGLLIFYGFGLDFNGRNFSQ